nr:site-specific integrase [Vibrio sp. 99-70-13A1]
MAKAFKTWVVWLVDKKIDPFSVPRVKYKSPTYGFRQHLIERINEEKSLKTSTANSYTLVIKGFYETLYDDGILDKSNFYRHKISTINGYRELQSSDLAIRVNRPVDNNLTPLSHETQLKALNLLQGQTKNFQLVFKLMIFCGLRLSEALSFPCRLIKEELFPNDSSKIIKGINIGPSHGVNTKFGADRELFMTVRLAHEILDHEYSFNLSLIREDYIERKCLTSKITPLFLNKSRKHYSKSAFYSAWARFKSLYKKTYHHEFQHGPHDLRSTFATNFVEVALHSSPDSIDTCIETVRLYMGHQSIETTLKYIRFVNKRKTANNVAEIMDRYIFDVFKEIA